MMPPRSGHAHCLVSFKWSRMSCECQSWTQALMYSPQMFSERYEGGAYLRHCAMHEYGNVMRVWAKDGINGCLKAYTFQLQPCLFKNLSQCTVFPRLPKLKVAPWQSKGAAAVGPKPAEQHRASVSCILESQMTVSATDLI